MDRAKGGVLREGGGGEEVAYAEKVEVGRDEDQDALRAVRGLRKAEKRGQDGGGKVFEARIWVGEGG